jgi:hypothetical protein
MGHESLDNVESATVFEKIGNIRTKIHYNGKKSGWFKQSKRGYIFFVKFIRIGAGYPGSDRGRKGISKPACFRAERYKVLFSATPV